MALQLANYKYRGIALPEAYLRVEQVQLQRKPTPAAVVAMAIYTSKAARDAGESPLETFDARIVDRPAPTDQQKAMYTAQNLPVPASLLASTAYTDTFGKVAATTDGAAAPTVTDGLITASYTALPSANANPNMGMIVLATLLTGATSV